MEADAAKAPVDDDVKPPVADAAKALVDERSYDTPREKQSLEEDEATASRAAAASIRPAPNTLSLPGDPRSTEVVIRMRARSDGVRVGFLCSMSAATPAACGQAMDVPFQFVWE